MSSRFPYILSGVAAAVVAAALAVVLYVQINTLAAEKDSAVRGLADERGRVSRLQDDLGRMKQDSDAQKVATEAVKRRAEKAEREGIEARERETALKDAYDKSRTAFVALEGELKAARAKAGETEASLKQTREALDAAEKDKGSLRDRAEKAEQERSEANGREAATQALLQAERQEHEKTRGLLAERDRELAAARRSGETSPH